MSKYLLAAAIFSASLTCAVSAQAANRAPSGAPLTAEQVASQKAIAKRLIKDAKQNGVFGVSRWQLNFDWFCTGTPGIAIIDANGDTHTWSDADSGLEYGPWERSKKALTFRFYDYQTVYVGTLSQDNQSAQGTMDDMQGGTGCWTADRL